MTNLTLHIENKATLEALLPLLQHLGVRYDITENNSVAEPTIAYEKPKPKRRLEDALLPKDPSIDQEAAWKYIMEAGNPNFNLEERLADLEEARQDRPMPFRD